MYVKRLEELQKTGNKVLEREREFKERPKAFDELGQAIVHYEKILTLYKDEVREERREGGREGRKGNPCVRCNEEGGLYVL